MELIETERPQIPNLITARIPETLKPYLSDLTIFERRKLATVIVLLLQEGVAVKMKVHEQKNMLVPVDSHTGHKFSISRSPLETDSEYKDKPGLLLEITNGFAMTPEFILITKENALTLAANLSIFLNEVNL